MGLNCYVANLDMKFKIGLKLLGDQHQNKILKWIQIVSWSTSKWNLNGFKLLDDQPWHENLEIKTNLKMKFRWAQIVKWQTLK